MSICKKTETELLIEELDNLKHKSEILDKYIGHVSDNNLDNIDHIHKKVDRVFLFSVFTCILTVIALIK